MAVKRREQHLKRWVNIVISNRTGLLCLHDTKRAIWSHIMFVLFRGLNGISSLCETQEWFLWTRKCHQSLERHAGEKHMDGGWYWKCSKGTQRPRERKECGASVYARCFSGYKSTTTKDTRQAIVCVCSMWRCAVLNVVFKILQYPVKWPVRSPVEPLMGELHYIFYTSLHIINLQRSRTSEATFCDGVRYPGFTLHRRCVHPLQVDTSNFSPAAWDSGVSS